MDDTAEAEISVEEVRTFPEEEIRNFLISEGCSFPPVEDLDNSILDRLDTEAVFGDLETTTPNSRMTTAKTFSIATRYLQLFPITDNHTNYLERAEWKQQLVRSGGLAKQAYNYLSKNNCLTGTNIMFAGFALETLMLVLRDDYLFLKKEMAKLGRDFCEVDGESYENISLTEKLELARDLRKRLFSFVKKLPQKPVED